MTPQDQLIKLLRSYNPDLPMGDGMKAQFLALREECERTPVVSPDANVEKNRQMLLERSVVGLKKYGVTTERDDLTLGQWVQHAIEEALDLANYLQALKTNLESFESVKWLDPTTNNGDIRSDAEWGRGWNACREYFLNLNRGDS